MWPDRVSNPGPLAHESDIVTLTFFFVFFFNINICVIYLLIMIYLLLKFDEICFSEF